MSLTHAPGIDTLSCGLTLLTEQNDAQRSASVCWLVPGGFADDPLPDGDGWASMNSEFMLRGANGMDSREFSDALDRLGARRSLVADAYFMRISLTVMAENLFPALDLMVQMIRKPDFPVDSMEAVRSLCQQELSGLEDDPSHLCMIRLDEIRLPRPFDRHGMGTQESLAAATRDQLLAHQQRLARPSGSIIAAAGAVNHEEMRTFLETRLEDWSGEGELPKAEGTSIGGEVRVERATSQTHLAMGFDAPLASDPDSLPFRAATSILGGGASSRLFLEVRERRGLAYSVGARYEPGFALGTSTISAGTTPERIQETMDCIQGVLADIEHGFTEEEVNRVRIQLRSGSLMQMEHGPARARQLAVDQFRLGRPRSLEDMLAEFESLDTDVVNEVSRRRMNEDWRARATRSIVGPAT